MGADICFCWANEQRTDGWWTYMGIWMSELVHALYVGSLVGHGERGPSCVGITGRYSVVSARESSRRVHGI